MPKQYTVLGRPMPRITTRRLAFALLTFSLFALISLSSVSSRVHTPSSIVRLEQKLPSVPKLKLPDKIKNSKYNPWRAAPHPPHRQQHDEYSGSSWWADWNWLSVPFSSSLSSSDDRSLLPPMADRPPVYCYYDATVQKPTSEKDAESQLLLTWRRAWWAQGFMPVIVGPTEAMGSSIYQAVQMMKLNKEVMADMMRWMAWETLGGGLLAQCTTFPMGPMEGDTLRFLRRGSFPSITKWTELGNGLIAGQKDEIRQALKSLMNPKSLEGNSVKTILEAIDPKYVVVDKDASAIAYYSPKVRQSYGHQTNSTNKREEKVQHMQDLVLIINAHLHTTWQGIFKDGVEVLRPYPNHTWPMVQEAYGYANALVACPKTPKPDSCPPNIKECTPCKGGKSELKLSTAEAYTNKSTVFTIGTVPHPWTLAVMDNMKEAIDVAFIRRNAPRDPWLTAVTKIVLGEEVSSSARVLSFKEAVAGEFAAAHALWLQAEIDTPTDLAWRFGFALPEVTGKDDNEADHNSNEEEKKQHAEERALLDAARKVVALKKSSKLAKTRASMEAWSMADAEAWRFAKTYLARRLLERVTWEEEEKKFAGGAGSEGGRNAWNRWHDLKEGAATEGDGAEW
ncbi:hypothetical protein NLU13_3481 [Sarocladium strictum]|uniref:Uncharacterized protein n=1 Tax=Sarocladium strictum TaxID=5046 RepID=A0AA39GNI5_SARSR|nr:hypothetical protein NLU13_3481 [Sarocladium strictum]